MKHYDIIIIGAGPAGIFAALEIVASGKGLKVLMVEKGLDIDQRICPSAQWKTSCTLCSECGLLCGWGGAGAFSDGKLSLSKEIGGNLSRYVSESELQGLIDYTDGLYIAYGAPSEVYGGDMDAVARIREAAEQNMLTLIPSKIRHIGTDRCPLVLKKMKEALNGKVDVLFSKDVRKILVEDGRAAGVEAGGETFQAGFVIVAPGREGALWLERQAKQMGLSLLKNPVDIGVRIEVPAATLENLTSVIYEPKLIYHTKKFNDRIRTFCVNPYGEVVKEYVKGVWIVNGHSYAHTKTENTNFALLVSTFFTEPFDEPHLYGRYVARLANLLGKGVILQRLGDLQAGRRSNPARVRRGKVKPSLADAVPGDLSFALPHRYISNILEMLKVMDRIAPGVNSPHTLLYGVEVKFYSRQLKLSRCLETEIENFFAIGDGAGVSRGLIQASASGIIAAREILKRQG
ncbi:MAG: NAD(P)/FAD-dependent oxidoreductase [Nitrospiraceae bacterium]|nr:MAG: NAD(P)/FAD-dependent oxidoreductase [Nitrospiraceae bacterium]